MHKNNIHSESDIKDMLLTHFGSSQVNVYFAPGRVNLIGEHTDYNGGHVFPCALSLGTYAAVRPRTDNTFCMYSLNFTEQGIINVSLDDLSYNPSDNWANYPKGIIWTLMERGYHISHGADILYYGNIPNGFGLSSSASIEVLTAYMFRDMFALNFDMTDTALMCQYAENNYNNVQCGIMDQFAIAMGKKNHATYLDTATLDYKYVPLNLGNYKLVIMNTNKQRKLGESKYNERRAECETALGLLQTTTPNVAVPGISSLGDLSVAEFDRHCHILDDDTLLRRTRHAVYENARTTDAVTALENNDLAEFGRLMTASHISLRDDYEVTGIELDTLVSSALKQPGVLGSRMTGAGFGGCAIALVDAASVDNFIKNTGKDYIEAIGYAADFYVAESGDGPRKIG